MYSEITVVQVGRRDVGGGKEVNDVWLFIDAFICGVGGEAGEGKGH